MSSSNSDLPQLSAQSVCAQQNEYSQISYSSQGKLAWLESSERTGYKTQLVCQSDSGIRLLSATDTSVGSRVHEYGGRSWCWAQDRLFYVQREDQQLYQVEFETGVITQLTHQPNQRFMEPLWDHASDSIIFVWEIHHEHQVENRIGRLQIFTGKLETLESGADFYAGLALNPTGTELAWVSWSHPELPWSGTQVFRAALDTQGLSDKQLISGGQKPESNAMPIYNQLGELHFISDRSGFWNLYKSTEESDQPLTPNSQDLISSPWQSGNAQYGFTSSGDLVHVEYSARGCSLVIAGKPLALEGFNHFRELCLTDNKLAVIAAGATLSPQVLELDLSSPMSPIKMLTPAESAFVHTSIAELIEFESEGETVHGYLYAPWDENALTPPLIVSLHGGPTSSTYPILNPAVQFWCSHGFAFFDLNYRGSSNSGRRYRELLKHRWGEADIIDIDNAIEHLLASGKATPGKIFIRGRSSGGYSTLLALARTRHFSAATSYFGVTEPKTLSTSTHKFESHYLDWLLPEDAWEASVADWAQEIKAPVLLLQGLEDKVVPPEQTEAIHQQLRSQGTESVARYFEGEGHGFRQLKNQVSALETELEFYRRALEPSN